MPQVIKIKQGLDIHLKGKAEQAVSCIEPTLFALQPTDFIALQPRLLVQEGDSVKIGTPLFLDKHDERIQFVSPVSGTVTEIRRGEKRLLQAIVIRCNEKQEALPFEIESINKESITQTLLKTGLWPMIRQRPYSTIARPDDHPKAFFISAFDTSPLAPDMDFIAEHFPILFKKV